MPRALWLITIPVAIWASGCLSTIGTLEKSSISLIPSTTTSTVVTANAPKVTFAPGSSDLAMKVDYVGQKILAANPDAKIKPYFATIGAPQAEVFHQSDKLVYITEGLVKKCKSEGQLAAVLSEELAAMEAERRTLARTRVRDADQSKPLTVPIGNAGQFNTPDLTHLAELSKVDRSPQQQPKRPAPIDTEALARSFLKNAHFADSDYESARPLLKEAESNCTLERQINGSAALLSR
jgi:hypothetical protein